MKTGSAATVWARVMRPLFVLLASSCLVSKLAAAPSTNVLRNGSFELPVLPANTYASYASISNWNISGLGWYLFNGPTSSDVGGVTPTDGQQQFWMGKDANVADTVTKQLGIASIQSNTVYTFKIDVMPNP